METPEHPSFDKDFTRRQISRVLNYILYLLIPLLAFLLLWSLLKHQKKIEELTSVNEEKASLVQEFTRLKEDYRLVKSWNEDYEEQITQDQDHIERLIREVRFKSDDIKEYRDDIEKYRDEIALLRDKLNQYLHAVDSLETTIQHGREMAETLESSRDSLVRKIKKASHLNAYNLDIRTENKRKKETRNPKRVDQVNICFTLAENIFIESGAKDIFMRILRPDERLIYASKNDLFTANGQELGYTAKVSVNYENTDTRVCILWQNVNTDLTEGLYYVNLYADGREITSRSFLLEKGFLFF
jgi:hypothetical protein